MSLRRETEVFCFGESKKFDWAKKRAKKAAGKVLNPIIPLVIEDELKVANMMILGIGGNFIRKRMKKKSESRAPIKPNSSNQVKIIECD